MAMDGYSSEGGRITDSEEQFLLELSPIPINKYTNMDYLTDFWGPVSNFGIPVAAVMDTQKSPELYVTFFPFAPRTKVKLFPERDSYQMYTKYNKRI